MKKAVVVIMIDALGHEIVERWKFSVEGLEKSARLRTVLGFSQAAILSILTSLPPREHGRWLMYSFARGRSPFGWTKVVPMSIGSDRLWFRRAVRFKLERYDGVSSYYSLYDIPRDVLPYLDLPLRRNYFRTKALDEGVNTILDVLRDGGINFRVWDYETSEREAFDELESLLAEGMEGFFLLYTAELDSLLHTHGTGGEPVGERLGFYGERIRKLFLTASRKYDKLGFFVFGDHGMCDVTGTIDVIGRIETLGLRIPDDYIPFYDSTMARFRVSSEKVRDRILGVLGGLDGGVVLSEGECAKLGIPVPGDEFGHILFLADRGNIILPSYMGKAPVSGMHGYHPQSPCMDSIMLTNVELGGGELQLTEIAPVLLDAFEVEAAGVKK